MSINNKIKYGEVLSPPQLVDEMLDMLPQCVYQNPNNIWVDPGAGTGIFASHVHTRLKFHHPQSQVHQMVHLVEINPDNITTLQKTFQTTQIHHADFLTLPITQFPHPPNIIVGNPPFNSNGIKKVPANKIANKKNDGYTAWVDFIRKSIALLAPNGYLCMITPAIWLKPDKAKIYNLLTSQNTLLSLSTYSCTESNKLFNYQCQTPTALFVVQKTPPSSPKFVSCYDKLIQKYVPYHLTPNIPIPMCGHYLINKIKRQHHILVNKTNSPPKKSEFRDKKSPTHAYLNIKTCKLVNNKPTLIINYSNIQQSYFNIPKIILAHKRLGCPMLDLTGKYGLSTRDNYVITAPPYTIPQLEIIHKFLSTKLVALLFECVKYRMNYLEKYVFELLPDITKLTDFPNITKITDESLVYYFNIKSALT